MPVMRYRVPVLESIALVACHPFCNSKVAVMQGSSPAMSSQGKQDNRKTVDDAWKEESFTARRDEESRLHLDAGALIVLEAKGDWWHAGFHMCSAIVGPPLLSLPFAISLMGWYGGLASLVVCGVVSMYAYYLFTLVLDRVAEEGHRQIRYRETAQYILGNTWAFYLVAGFQLGLCFLSVAFLILLSGTFLKAIYILYHPEGDVQLYVFIIVFGALAMVLAQLPSFHSLRHINFAATLLTFLYSAIAAGGSIYSGHSSRPLEKNYGIPDRGVSRMFNIFFAISVMTATYGSAIVPEIQATIAPPVVGKMVKGLALCYTVIWTTYLSVGITGYWAFGNHVSANVLLSLSSTLPRWLSLAGNLCAGVQVVASTLVYMQPCFEVIEGKSADATKGTLSKRNLLPRLVLRSLLVAITTLLAAMFPFIGDVIAILGAFGAIPLDYILPFVFHVIVFKPSSRSREYWLHCIIPAVFSVIGVVAAVGSVRQLVLDASTYKLFANL